ncbi:hypothetical protein CROQUDRAFT_700304, partial [Cronartium quercuum f. sp. fusiforme G11]
MYLGKLQEKMFNLTGIWVTLSKITQILHQKLGLSLLVSQALDCRQCPVAQAAFVAAVHQIPADYLVFIDESGVKNMDVWQTRGWEKRGSAGACDLRNQENDHWTILPAVSEGGMIAAITEKGPVECVHVEVFLKRQLVSGLH